jgi:hypothetical protein
MCVHIKYRKLNYRMTTFHGGRSAKCINNRRNKRSAKRITA